MKAIILTRVSTDRQEIERQRAELVALAKSHGYGEGDLVYIEGVGASAIKHNKRYLKEMDELFSAVESDGEVKALYAWEISRIGRDEEMLHKVRKFLISRGVNLIIKNPSLTLMDPDGSVNKGVEVTFSLFATMSRQEMEIKSARFRRKKKEYSEKGIWSGGGQVRYGYLIDGKKAYRPDPAASQVVRDAFRLYLTPGYGVGKVRDELAAMGHPFNKRQVLRILSFEGYTGKCKIERGNERTFPPLISRETFEAAERKRKDSDAYRDKSSRHYLGAGLVVCQECGHRYTVQSGNRVYTCIEHCHKGAHTGKCRHSAVISVNALDTLLWEDARQEFIDYCTSDTDRRRDEISESIRVTLQKLSKIDKDLASVDERRKVFRDEYNEFKIETDEYLSRCDNLDRKKAENERRRRSLSDELEALRASLSEIDSPDFIDAWMTAEKRADSVGDFEEMYGIVHRFIVKVRLERCECEGEKAMRVTMTHDTGTESTYVYFPTRRNKCRYCREPDVIVGSTKEQLLEMGLYYTHLDGIKQLVRIQPKKRARKTAQERLKEVG